MKIEEKSNKLKEKNDITKQHIGNSKLKILVISKYDELINLTITGDNLKLSYELVDTIKINLTTPPVIK